RTLYPADFIAEGVDQTRGWFFTLHAIAGMLFDSVAYKAVVSNGLVLDKFGNKMSKHKGNTVDPFGQIATYGSDPVRWYMMANSAPWDNLKYDEKGVLETSRKLFGTLYNTYGFFALYANVDGFDPAAPQVPVAKRPEIDRWILSLLNTLTREVTEALDDYEPTRAARAIADFVGDNLSNWYVRLNRRRFWGGEMTEDKLAAYQTLYTCLRTLALLMAPFAPFYSERLWRDLTAGAEGSVHLAKFPEFDSSLAAPELEARQKMAQDITSMALALRKKENIKVRQPLGTLMVPVTDDTQRTTLEAIAELVKSELNIKELRIVSDDQGIIVKRLKPDFKKLGPKHGKNMKAVAAAVTSLDTKAVNRLEKDGCIDIEVAGTAVSIELTDVEVISEDIPGWLVANEGALTIALDITVTPELKREGIARDIVNRIQRTRKERGYEITDRITLSFEPNEATDDAIRAFADYISGQVLATDLEISPTQLDAADPEVVELDMDDFKLNVRITK
ncbi:MAG: class I tRNA ligase family protein, partial [Duncaniella sp.]|nr:class I tRNA ligase family protein [Duncaniella sp.]